MIVVALKWIGGTLVVLLVSALALRGLGALRWSSATEALVAQLDATRQTLQPARYDAARELDGLPPPVQRYFRATLKDGQPMLAALRLEHRGTFNLADAGPDRWQPFTSTQRVIARRPGFVWDGRVAMAPGLAVHVHDAYVGGEGVLHPAVMGLFSLTELRGRSAEPGGVAHGELMRWLAEAAWFPTALLPSQGVRWHAVDADSADATLADGAVSVTLRFRFDAMGGDIVSVRSEARGRTVGTAVVATPWEGRWFEHAERDGLRVPLRGEVAWLAPEGERVYWRGEVTTFAPEWVR
jgi:hypothetical protein